jgi:hypothetical protein
MHILRNNLRATLRDNGLTIVLMLAFLASLFGMAWTGWTDHNAELARHGMPATALAAYLASGDFLSMVFENWESEFLQMGTYVVLTAYLFQRGSAESNDPDDAAEEDDAPPDGWKDTSPFARWLWSHSLGLALIALFAASFVLHWLSSHAAANAEAALHGEAPTGVLDHLASARLWFESFQNWQSEFLSTAVLVVLSVFLRYKGSPESKKLRQTNAETGS